MARGEKKKGQDQAPSSAKGGVSVSRAKKVNCQLPGAELLDQGKSVQEAMAELGKPKRGPGRPPIFETADEMQSAVDDYFESCWDLVEITKGEGAAAVTETKRVQVRPYTVMGLAVALGMCRDTLCEYAKNGTFSDTVKRAKQLVEMSVEETLLAGKNSAGPIFWLKNNSNYRDKQEVEQSGSLEIRRIERVVVKPK